MEPEAYFEMDQVEQQHGWFVARRKIIRSKLSEITSAHSCAKILEVGCGTGGNLEMLNAFGKVVKW